MHKLLILIFFISCNTAQTQLVVGVHDGDTFYTNSSDKAIRLAEIDAPEYSQQYGIDARNYLASLVLYQKVRLVKVATDKYGRNVCQVYVGDIWVNKAIVDAGYAWAYKGLSSLHNAQIHARNAKKGMWATSYNIPPFKYRKK